MAGHFGLCIGNREKETEEDLLIAVRMCWEAKEAKPVIKQQQNFYFVSQYFSDDDPLLTLKQKLFAIISTKKTTQRKRFVWAAMFKARKSANNKKKDPKTFNSKQQRALESFGSGIEMEKQQSLRAAISMERRKKRAAHNTKLWWNNVIILLISKQHRELEYAAKQKASRGQKQKTY